MCSHSPGWRLIMDTNGDLNSAYLATSLGEFDRIKGTLRGNIYKRHEFNPRIRYDPFENGQIRGRTLSISGQFRRFGDAEGNCRSVITFSAERISNNMDGHFRSALVILLVKLFSIFLCLPNFWAIHPLWVFPARLTAPGRIPASRVLCPARLSFGSF